jgi:ABC-type transport system substrate-binding protein
MKIKNALISLSLAAVCAQSAVAAPGFRFRAQPTLVGLWQTTATLGACAGGPTHTFLALENYHEGGTFSDTQVINPNARGPGSGIWKQTGYNAYSLHFQFFRFLPDGSFDGIQDIYQDAKMNADGATYTSTIYARVLNADGSLRVEACGNSTGERVAMDH